MKKDKVIVEIDYYGTVRVYSSMRAWKRCNPDIDKHMRRESPCDGIIEFYSSPTRGESEEETKEYTLYEETVIK